MQPAGRWSGKWCSIDTNLFTSVWSSLHDQDMCHCYWPWRKGESTNYGELSVTLVSEENCEDCIIRKLEVSENTPQTTIPYVRLKFYIVWDKTKYYFISLCVIGTCQSSLHCDPLPVSMLAWLWPASYLLLTAGADGQCHKGADEHRKQGHYCNVQVSVMVVLLNFIMFTSCMYM